MGDCRRALKFLSASLAFGGMLVLVLMLWPGSPSSARAFREKRRGFKLWRYDGVQEFIKYIRQSTVRVEVTGKVSALFDPAYPLRFEGGGVALTPRLVLTSHPYLIAMNRIEVITWRKKRYSARMIFKDARTGLALLAVDHEGFRKSIRPAKMALRKKTPKRGKLQVYVLGNSGLGWKMLKNGVLKIQKGLFFGQVDLYVRNGVPLFDDRGDIKAIAFKRLQDWSGSQVIPERVIGRFLKMCRKRGLLPRIKARKAVRSKR